MAGGMSRMAKRELLASIQERHQGSSKRDKGCRFVNALRLCPGKLLRENVLL